MFVLSMKTTRPRLAAYIAVCGMLVAVVLGTRALSRPHVPAAAGRTDDPVAYLQGLGYEAEPQWTALQELVVPGADDPAFAALNAVLQAAGYDLTAYQGERVKCYTYTVHNYPGTERAQVRVYTHKGRVVAGDIITESGAPGALQPRSFVAAQEGETDGTTG